MSTGQATPRAESAGEPDLGAVTTAVARAQAALQRPVLVALDGRSGAGKSTLARRLAESIDGRVVVADDFWSGGPDAVWAARTPPERAASAIDWRRLRVEALLPLLAAHRASWRPFDWETGEGLSEHALVCEPGPVIVLDGAYSGRPELADLVDVAVLVILHDDERRSRLVAREGEAYMRRWHQLWDPAEEHYFGHVCTPDAFDVVVAMPCAAARRAGVRVPRAQGLPRRPRRLNGPGARAV